MAIRHRAALTALLTTAFTVALATALTAALAGCGFDAGPSGTRPQTLPYGERAPELGGADLSGQLRRMLTVSRAPGGAVLVRAAGRTRYTAAGASDVGSGRGVRRADHFRGGSLTKTFVATVVLQLAAEDRLGLDDRVRRHLPGVLGGPSAQGRGDDDGDGVRMDAGHGGSGHTDDGHTAGGSADSGHTSDGNAGDERPGSASANGAHTDSRNITIRQLLNHTSGLFDYTGDRTLARELFGEGFARHRFDTRTPEALVRTALAHPPAFAPPGTGWRYSNTDYVLLGMVIEKVTGHGYADEIRRRIIKPLRLRGTSFPGTRSTLPAPHGRAYTATGGGAPRDVTELNPSSAGAAGEVVSTLDDLTRFYGALLGGEVLGARQLKLMLDTTGTYDQYGMGLFPIPLACGILWGHNGVINGSSALVVSNRTGRHVLAYRLNTDTGAGPQAERALLRAEFCEPGDAAAPPTRSTRRNG
ncbi:serine hydrolase domain-containing protein [Streptomyces sp. P1-3]|uniref:serine hydrolase domain-containing protein n=1 Tax=Streptomyces sp. P1-3 TaxID=3421658 RepID=UPI003D363D62